MTTERGRSRGRGAAEVKGTGGRRGEVEVSWRQCPIHEKWFARRNSDWSILIFSGVNFKVGWFAQAQVLSILVRSLSDGKLLAACRPVACDHVSTEEKDDVHLSPWERSRSGVTAVS